MASIGSLLSAFLLASSLPLALTAEPQPYFGNKDGNFQPTRTSRVGGATIKLTGGQVGGALAVNSINNQDGIGGGSDTYTQYCGNGDAFPPKSSWVSFEQMCVLELLTAPPQSLCAFFLKNLIIYVGSMPTRHSCLPPVATTIGAPTTPDQRLAPSTTRSNKSL